MRAPKIHVAPAGLRDWIRDGVQAGGGELVGPDQADALVFTATSDPDGLRELLDAHPNIRWVQLPWAGIEAYADAGVLDPNRT